MWKRYLWVWQNSNRTLNYVDCMRYHMRLMMMISFIIVFGDVGEGKRVILYWLGLDIGKEEGGDFLSLYKLKGRHNKKF